METTPISVAPKKPARTAVMWSGGKDSFLSYLLAKDELEVEKPVFVTDLAMFGHRKNYDVDFSFADFRCLIDQSRHFGADHLLIFSKHNCVVQKKADVATYLLNRYDVKEFIFGDIFPSIEEWKKGKSGCAACKVRSVTKANTGLEPVFPLMGLSIEDILERIESKRVRALIFGVSSEQITSLLGQFVSLDLMKEQMIYGSDKFDPLGENGNYQTLVTGYGEYDFKTSERVRLYEQWIKFRQAELNTELVEGENVINDVFDDMMMMLIQRPDE